MDYGCERKNAREFIIGSTSSGKTLIPLVCYKTDKRRFERKAKLLYLVPYRALATQKEREFIQKFSEERIIVSTSEYCSEDVNVMNGNCDIAIVIYEKVFMFLSNDKNFLVQYTQNGRGTIASGKKSDVGGLLQTGKRKQLERKESYG